MLEGFRIYRAFVAFARPSVLPGATKKSTGYKEPCEGIENTLFTWKIYYFTVISRSTPCSFSNYQLTVKFPSGKKLRIIVLTEGL